jgi:outer membrane receptor protein involved in Fe transport
MTSIRNSESNMLGALQRALHPSPRAIGRALVCALVALALVRPARAAATDADTVSMAHDPARYGIVVSATKTTRNPIDIANGTAVVSGRELRRAGARTLADALIDVAGVEAGGGSDNGTRITNVGMWGLKEFDALLVTVDGVPVGGPFNPSLAQIAVDDIERIEIVKGPQGTMHGMSAFAGTVNVVTDRSTAGRGELMLGGGDYTNFHGTARGHKEVNGWTMDGSVSALRDDGWQERTESENYRGRYSLTHALWGGTAGMDITGLHDRGDWGSPLPVDQGVPVAGFDRDRNYAIGGAEVKHDVFGLNTHGSWPVNEKLRFDNTLGFSYDAQHALRSFFEDPGAIVGDTAIDAEGIDLEPKETTLFEDLRAVTKLELAGRHELVTGASLTWGQTKADGHGFDFDQDLLDPASIPNASDVPPGDNRSFDDTRTYFGFYAHDEWTPSRYVTISGGGRFDQANEDLNTTFEELSVPTPVVKTSDSQNINDWSGDIGALIRLLPDGAKGIEALNVYGSWKSFVQARGAEPERGRERRDPGSRAHALDRRWFEGARARRPARTRRERLPNGLHEHGRHHPRRLEQPRAGERRPRAVQGLGGAAHRAPEPRARARALGRLRVARPALRRVHVRDAGRPVPRRERQPDRAGATPAVERARGLLEAERSGRVGRVSPPGRARAQPAQHVLRRSVR